VNPQEGFYGRGCSDFLIVAEKVTRERIAATRSVIASQLRYHDHGVAQIALSGWPAMPEPAAWNSSRSALL
jgi:hypothetical protein